jgi:hypothetical protein
VGTLVTVGCALAFAVLWMNAGDRKPVIAVAHRVPAGREISASDLKVVRVSVDPGLDTIPSSRLDEVEGLTAATDLVPGALLAREQLAPKGSGFQAGTAVVGVALPPGRLPDGLQVGDRVAIVRTIPPGSSSSDRESGSLGTVLDEGTVYSIGDGDLANGTKVVSLVVDEDVAAEVAGAASADAVSLVLLPVGSR